MSKKNRSQIQPKKISKKGLPPGSSVYVGEDREGHSIINVISYKFENARFYNNYDLEKISDLDENLFHWINVIGIHNVQVVDKICKYFKIHALTEEDILNTQTRPKCEIYDNYIVSSLKMIKNENPFILIEEEHITLLLIKNVVISFQEVEGDVFNPIRERFNNTESRLRNKGSDYLFFLLHDIIVDNYIEVMDTVDENNEKLEEEILNRFHSSLLTSIQNTKSDLLYLKKMIFPLKESIIKIIRAKCNMIEKENLRYYEDLNDHILYCCEDIETQREVIFNLRELYMSMNSNSMGNVMKVLTIVSSIFIPLTFIVGLYGMNFTNMPELKTKYGYFYVLGIMFIIAILMIYYFRRKRWL